MAQKNNFSLTLIVMIFAIIAIFVGYFLGNWMIKTALSTPEQTSEVPKQQEVSKTDNNNQDVEIDEKDKATVTNENINTGSFSNEDYAVQVGAFNNYNNALSLKKELENEGYEVIITEGSPHKVRLGPSSEKKGAEKIKEELEAMGYNGFVINLNN